MNQNVAIVTDSNAYFEPGEAEALNIHVVPLQLQLSDGTLIKSTDIDSATMFAQVQPGEPLPISLPPEPEDFEALYTKLHKETNYILSLHNSPHLDDTLRRAQQGAESLLGRCTIEILDSMTTSVGLGTLVSAAARAAQDGMPLDDIVKLVRGMIPHIYLVFFVETMSYLERGGRIGQAQAILGSMLNIKPILFMEDGDIIPLEKVRTTEKALDKLYEFVTEFDTLEKTAIIQCGSEPTHEAMALKNRLNNNFGKIYFPIIQYGPELATHIGPDAMGVVVYEGLAF